MVEVINCVPKWCFVLAKMKWKRKVKFGVTWKRKVVKGKSREIGYFVGYVTVITTSLPQIKIRGKEFLQCYNLGCDCLFPQRRKIPGLISDRKDGFTFSMVRMLYFRSNIHSVQCYLEMKGGW